jgi:hypothetical protein
MLLARSGSFLINASTLAQALFDASSRSAAVGI